jgi:hypothetical protein
MSATESIFMKLALAIQTCVQNYNIKFNENPTNGGVTDTRSQTERHIWPPHKTFLFILRRTLKYSVTSL